MGTSTSLSNLALNRSIRDGETLVSEGGTFESGFFSPGSSNGRYFGVWFRNSFDYPGDTLLLGMKLGLNLETGLDRFVTSWKSEDDPAKGDFSFKFDLRGYPELYFRKGSVIKIRKGSRNGVAFTGSIFSLFKITPLGSGQRMVWTNQTRNPEVIASGGQDQGFIPKFPEEWNLSYWSNGSVRRTTLDCGNKNGFCRYTNMKLPDTSSWFYKTMNLKECQKLYLRDCSCTAYANLDIRSGGSGCLHWFDDLIDIRMFLQNGQDFYLKVPASELDHDADGNIKKQLEIIGGVISFALTTCASIVIHKRESGSSPLTGEEPLHEQTDEGRHKSADI
ncbi:hypothetical protein VNO77_37215 [Canavalia gladiata]|uniref:Apple domain-containing protein n=1 Tax=Canavalia gladiata TaxID=3824 RepID=A0AAN9KAA8_CANGL